MNSQILSKVNYFVKNRLIELSGVLVVLFAIFLFVSISTYFPSDPNFIYTPENIEIKNFGGFYGSVVSDFFLQSIGVVSFFNDLEIFSLLRKLKLFSDIAIVLLDLVFLLISLVIRSIAQLSFERLIAVTNPVRLPPIIHIFCFFMILFFIN